MRVLNHSFDQPLKSEECAAMPLAGGIMQHGYQCGMIWGSALAAGAQAHRLFGTGPRAETRAILASQRLIGTFRALNKHTDCIEITGIDKSSSALQMNLHFFIKGGTIDCIRMATKYAKAAYSEINTSLSEEHLKNLSSPTSCSALLAQKIGLSGIHKVMAAGLAGGIGLSGGACGALGTAIWMSGLSVVTGGDKLDFINPKGADIIGTFIKCTDNEFECSKIVGRRFNDANDHADYLRSGGCSNIINALSAKMDLA